MIRRFCVLIHRWGGLAMTGFLVVVGLTGSLLAFNSELEIWNNPHLYPAPHHGLQPLGLGELALRAEALVPEAHVSGVVMGEPGWRWISVEPRINIETGKPYVLGYNQIFLDPYTGEELGRREWGAISQGWINLISFIYELHYSLALSMTGVWILGIVALAWTLDCFVGFYLTLPKRRRQVAPTTLQSPATTNKSWWTRWKPAWKICWGAGRLKLNFDLHRAGGLWLWAVLLIFAWSSVYMNLWDTVYTWSTRAVLEFKAPWTELAPLQVALEQPALNWKEAQATGERLMAEQARQHNFIVERPLALSLNREQGVYQYSVRSSLDIGDHDRRGMTQLYFDADSGAFKLLLLPTGQYSGNTVTTWLYSLHMGNVFGMPYRIFVCLLGLLVVMLGVTGVIVWLNKRRARRVAGIYASSHHG